MDSTNIIQAISGGICLYAGIIHLFIGFKKDAQFKVHLFFSAICILFSIYNLQFFLYNIDTASTSLTKIIFSNKSGLGFLAFIFISLWLLHKIDTEEKLIKNKERTTRALLDAPDDFILLFDQNGIITEINNSALKNYNKKREEMIGASVWKLFPESIIIHRKKYVNRVIALKKPIRFEDESNNICFDNILYPILDNNNRVTMIAVFVRDITKQKKFEKKIKSRTTLLRRAQQVGKIGHWHFNLTTHKLTWSNETYRLFSFEPNEFEPTYSQFLTMVHKDDKEKVHETYLSVIKTKNEYDFTYRIKTKEGHIRYVRERCLTEFDKDNMPLNIFGTIQDITELKKIEYDLIAAKEKAEESDKLKSAFLANISHEIRTPMNAILGFADLLQNNKLSTSAKNEYIYEIEKGSKRMLNIISDLIEISKIEAIPIELNKQKTNINELLNELLAVFKEEAINKGIKLICLKELSDRKSIISIDKDLITKALVNLICNALKFTNHGQIIFGYTLKKDILEFFVRDTGIGITPQMQPLIFDSFRQVDIADSSYYEGAGLGLSISKAFIEAHGGDIRVESEINKGSIFYFTIPYTFSETLKTENENSFFSFSDELEMSFKDEKFFDRNPKPEKKADDTQKGQEDFFALLEEFEDIDFSTTVQRNIKSVKILKEENTNTKHSPKNILNTINYKKDK